MASPAKRRVLAPLDANANIQSPSMLSKKLPVDKIEKPEKLSLPDSASLLMNSPRKNPPSTSTSTVAPLRDTDMPSPEASPNAARKRPLPHDETADNTKHGAQQQQQQSLSSSSSPKRMRLTGPQTQAQAKAPRPSLSSPASSVFDVSATSLVDTTQTTNITEPETETTARTAAAVAARLLPRPPVQLTREQSRQKMEILRLRLGLAHYKLRTGQVDVPLEQLRVVPAPQPSRAASPSLPPRGRSRTPLPSAPRRQATPPAATAVAATSSGAWTASEWVRRQQEERQQQQKEDRDNNSSSHDEVMLDRPSFDTVDRIEDSASDGSRHEEMEEEEESSNNHNKDEHDEKPSVLPSTNSSQNDVVPTTPETDRHQQNQSQLQGGAAAHGLLRLSQG